MWPRIGRPAFTDFWDCPGCGRPAKFWLIYFMDIPRWRCEHCGISARLDASEADER